MFSREWDQRWKYSVRVDRSWRHSVRVACLSPRDASCWQQMVLLSYEKTWLPCWNPRGTTIGLTQLRTSWSLLTHAPHTRVSRKKQNFLLFFQWGSMLYDTYEFWLLVLMYYRFSRGLRNRSARPGNSKWAWPSRCGRWCWLQRVSLMRVEFETWNQDLSSCLSAQSLWDFDSLNEIG